MSDTNAVSRLLTAVVGALVYFLQQTPKCSGFCSQFSCFWIVHTPFTPLVDDIPIFTFQTLKNAGLL